jgi:hypothetical protein
METHWSKINDEQYKHQTSCFDNYKTLINLKKE